MSRLTRAQRYDHVAIVVQCRMANYFQIFPPLAFSYWLFFFTNYRGNFQVSYRTWVKKVCRGKPRKISKRGLDRSQMEQPIKKSKFSYFTRSRLHAASSTRDLGTRLSEDATPHLLVGKRWLWWWWWLIKQNVPFCWEIVTHDRNINNEQTQNCNQNGSVCKLIVDVIPYRMSTFVLISIFRFFEPFALTFVSNLVLQWIF